MSTEASPPTSGVNRAFWRRFRATAGLYWRSEDRATARALLAILILLLFAQSGFHVLYVSQTGEFTSALAARDAERFWLVIGQCGLTLLASIPTYSFFYYVRSRLGLRWRRWMTAHFLRAYLCERRYYELTPASGLDNPDQRIAEDISAFTQQSLFFLLVALGALIQLLAFVGVLWTISPPLVFVLVGYAIAGNLLTTGVFGRVLIGLNFLQLRKEADFRFALVRVREHAEPIALHRGEASETHRALHVFGAAYANFLRVIRAQLNLSFFQYVFSFTALVLPFAVIAPAVLAGEVEVGRAVQAAGAFAAVLSAVTVIIEHFEGLSKFAASVDRLEEFARLMLAGPPAGAGEDETIVSTDSPRIGIEHLSVRTPGGERLLLEDLSLAVEPGHGLMIVGGSGSGKTSLLRAIAGLWRRGSGHIGRPPPEAMMFLPQQPYMTAGTLRSQILYPRIDGGIADATLRELLDQVNLSRLEAHFGGFDEEHDWAKVLSLGEQQRLAMARVLLARPRYVMLDEATSALDATNEEALYQRLQVAGITPVSVSHRSALLPFHAQVLELAGDGTWRLVEAQGYRFPGVE